MQLCCILHDKCYASRIRQKECDKSFIACFDNVCQETYVKQYKGSKFRSPSQETIEKYSKFLCEVDRENIINQLGRIGFISKNLASRILKGWPVDCIVFKPYYRQCLDKTFILSQIYNEY